MNFISSSSGRFAPLLAAFLIFTANVSFAQISGGGSALQGVVKGSSGAVIPGATITVTDGNGGTHKTRTRADGHYLIKDLPPATFLESTGITGGFGPESVASNQRRIDLQLRFSF